jgi:hypothetical protein
MMFKTTITKLPVLLLALLASLITLSTPARVISLAQESENEIVELLEAKEFCERKHETRRLRQQQFPIKVVPALEELRQVPVLAEFNPLPQSIWLASPPLLRAPPA